MASTIFRSVNRWVLLGAVIVAAFLCGFALIAFSLRSQIGSSAQRATAELVVIPAPSTTPTLQVLPTETPEVPIKVDGIQAGIYVQIAGTEGAGLRIRSGPGKTYQPEFSGYDSEVFLVKDGPVEADGITWWLLTAPYDNSRSGWAAANYLKVVALDE
ncbi:MAG: hypothetical protein HPY76_14685 [Anaerolineae bacterium]|nr:hypothetical protein [Anaerolineae bacterium]